MGSSVRGKRVAYLRAPVVRSPSAPAGGAGAGTPGLPPQPASNAPISAISSRAVPRNVGDVATSLIESVPESGYGVEHRFSRREKPLRREARLRECFAHLVGGVRRVVLFERVVPRPKS